nr:hypothetical protein [Tanacetum cinerariifolium]
MELYMLNRPHGRMILESFEQGPLIWPSVEVERVTRLNKYSELSAAEAIQADFRDQDAAPTARECTFTGFMKCNPTAFHGTKGVVKLRRWFEKTESVFGISECAEGKKVKFAAATLPSLSSRRKGEVDDSPTSWTLAGTILSLCSIVFSALIIMVNIIPLDHVDDVRVVEPNQHDNVPVVPEPILLDEDEDPKEEEPQEEEDDMEVDIEEDENELELTYPYEEVDPLNPSPPAFESEPEDVTKAENTIEHKDKTVPASVHEVGESYTSPFLREDSDGLLPDLMRRDINSLFGRMDCLSRRLCGRETAHALIEKKGKAKDKYYDKVECKKLKKEVEEARFSNTFLRMQNERFERYLYWTRVRAHEFYQEMIHRGFVFEERPNETIDVPVKIMPPKSAPLTQAAIRRMIKESVDVAITAERARHANAGNDDRGSGPVRDQDAAPTARDISKVKI